MGASEKTMTLDGKLTEEQVKQKFYDRQEEDRDYYGTDPYNGSFSTFNGIVFCVRTFTNEDEAVDYILEESKKWGPAIAAKYKVSETEFKWLIGGWAAE